MAKKSWGNWQNESSIAEGGGGRVFLVKNTIDGRLGALKELKNPNRLGRFRGEIESVNKIDCKYICKVIDFSIDSHPYYAVFEYVDGGTIQDIADKNKLLDIPLETRLFWCTQLCEALNSAHENGIIHRDVKPDNVLVTAGNKEIRLCDFGLVYTDDKNERQTLTMEQVGSRYYIPPECEDGRLDQVNASLDIYSLGKTIFFILSGKMFAREKHRSAENDLSKINSNPHFESISRILDKCITTSQSDREISAEKIKLLIFEAMRTILDKKPIAGVGDTYICTFCAKGKYKVVAYSGDHTASYNLGYESEGKMHGETMAFLECENCGNCQRHKLKYGGERWFPKEFELN